MSTFDTEIGQIQSELNSYEKYFVFQNTFIVHKKLSLYNIMRQRTHMSK